MRIRVWVVCAMIFLGARWIADIVLLFLEYAWMLDLGETLRNFMIVPILTFSAAWGIISYFEGFSFRIPVRLVWENGTLMVTWDKNDER